MKHLVSAVLVVFIVGIAFPVMAAFELGNMQIVAYEEADQGIPISNIGNEVHFDLGATAANYVNGTMDAFSVSTGITLSDYGVTS